jgi:hypothetical protein
MIETYDAPADMWIVMDRRWRTFGFVMGQPCQDGRASGTRWGKACRSWLGGRQSGRGADPMVAGGGHAPR